MMPRVLVLLALCVAKCLPGFAAALPPEQAEFFETKVRPILVEHCYECHSARAKKIKGGLQLDSAASLLKGGASGVAIVSGNPDASSLVKAVRYQDPELQMPPDEKLSDAQIQALVEWVRMGAPDPRTTEGPVPASSFDEARDHHWAFQAVVKPAVPVVKKSAAVQTPVDNFILAKLEALNLKPAPIADRRTLIRRLSYDLTGLPPTPEEVEAFSKDKRKDAVAQLVDRLLASPRYGERWGRYWLDVARYADTKGYLAGGEERRFPFSHTYRDYVVKAFNDDLPYDQFIIEQIAADRQPPREDKSPLAALGFLTLGRRFLNNQNDIIDDRIDVVTRGTMGLTVTCARCHDHKFDPISMKDYYALHGIFASSQEPSERPLLKPLSDSPDYQDYLKKRAAIEAEITEFEEKEIDIFVSDRRQQAADYLLAANAAKRLADQSKFDTLAGEHKTLPALLRRWVSELDARNKTNDAIFGPWFALTALPENSFPTNPVAVLAEVSSGSTNLNPAVYRVFSNVPPTSLQQAATLYGQLFKDVEKEWASAIAEAAKKKEAKPTQLPDPAREELRQFLYAENSPANPPRAEVRKLHARRLGEGAAPMRNRIEALSWTHAGAPARAMALEDSAHPHDSHIAKRGNPDNRGDLAPRRFLEILGGLQRGNFTNGSGRLELARAIASKDNPLTARVYVNRVWQHHFGVGLVPTAGDFGVRTEAPPLRELLDFLAADFVEHGWSTKWLQRQILLSATYQRTCDISGEASERDPENKYYSHMNRQRLDFESLRDSLLFVSGTLNTNMGGASVDLLSEPFSSRRTIYGLIDRQNLPGVLRAFDFASPDASNQGRFHTIVPQQALFMMNNPFVIAQARNLAERIVNHSAGTPEAEVEALYALVLQRRPDSQELRAGQKFLVVRTSTETEISPIQKLAQVLLLSNELAFVD